jgi:glucose-1-phosphate adenylyltransferase
MNYNDMVATHVKNKADVTIGALPCDREAAAGFGIMRLDDSGRVVGFLEKPKTEAELALVRTDPAWMDAQGIDSRGRDCLASMGIYLFNRDKLIDLLTKTDYHDFGKEIFPASIRTHRVQVHMFDGYWEDIGTIKSFYQCNLDLARSDPPFDLNSAVAPIYTRSRFLPPSQLDGATVTRSLISDGSTIAEGSRIENSVIGLRCRIGKNVTIRNSIVMGCDFYQTPDEIAADQAQGRPLMAIGDGTLIDKAIVDKNCRIGRNVRITNERCLENAHDDNAPAMIRDGIVVVPKETTLADNWRF